MLDHAAFCWKLLSNAIFLAQNAFGIHYSVKCPEYTYTTFYMEQWVNLCKHSQCFFLPIFPCISDPSCSFSFISPPSPWMSNQEKRFPIDQWPRRQKESRENEEEGAFLRIQYVTKLTHQNQIFTIAKATRSEVSEAKCSKIKNLWVEESREHEIAI